MREIGQREIEDFEAYLLREERSRGTVEKYLRDVRRFADWAAEQGRDCGITREKAASWKQSLLEQGYRPSTINSMLAAINCFFRFIGWEDCRIRFLRIQKRNFRQKERELTRSDYEKLLKSAQSSGKRRLALLMEAVCSTGIRVSEVKYLTVEAAAQGRAEIAMKGKIRVILLPAKLCRKLAKYARRENISSGEIFVTSSGKSLGRKQIWAEMKQLCRKAGVEESRVFPHNLRHLFARTFYRACRDLTRLADLLGHSSVDTTRIYLKTTEAEQAKELNRLNLVS
ncbi:MAG: tyrosine-type recombinase/integrase [Emergencia sp.]